MVILPPLIRNTIMHKRTVIGVGYRSSKKYSGAKHNRVYKIWQEMIRRCYLPKHPFYRYYGAMGVTVCDEWHDFIAYADWYYENHIAGCQVDKDANGSKVYSPATRQFINQAANIELSQAKHYTFVSPDGVLTKVFNLQKFSRENGLSASNLLLVLKGKVKQCKGWTKPPECWLNRSLEEFSNLLLILKPKG